MLNFLKKIFAKEEVPEERIGLDKLSSWLDEKAKPLFEDLDTYIKQVISKINEEKQRAFENIKKLEAAELQNPKIPERVKTVAEGNRTAFIKKTLFLFNNLHLEFSGKEGYINIAKKCKDTENDIDLLGKATARSYQILGQFFAREAEPIAISIKNVENFSKDIVKAINSDKISGIGKIKNNITEIKEKIRLKEDYINDLESNKNSLTEDKSKKEDIENNINQIKASEDFVNYEKYLKEKDHIGIEIQVIENLLFHDFSALDRALKKYAKTAFEDESLVMEYLDSPIKALAADNNLKIIKILDGLKRSVSENRLDLDSKRNEKTLSKIKELDNSYFIKNKDRLRNLNERLCKICLETENNRSKKELENYKEKLKVAELDIESTTKKISNLSSSLGEIDIEKMREMLQNEINGLLNTRLVITCLS
jgi:hypothetical protein